MIYINCFFIIILFSSITAFALTITFLDVGHGDCILLETEKVTVAVDTGDIKGGRKLKNLLSEKKKKLDFLFITHPHPDHFYGTSKILDKLKNDIIFHNGDIYNDPGYHKTISKINKRSKFLKKVMKGDVFDFESFKIEILHPDKEFLKNNTDLNDRSLVMMVIKGGSRLLLTSDITAHAQDYLLKNICRDDLRSDILKFPHHCSSASFNEDFIRAVKPRVVVVSVGPSEYNYPDEECIKRLESLVPVLMRTDKEGSVSIIW